MGVYLGGFGLQIDDYKVISYKGRNNGSSYKGKKKQHKKYKHFRFKVQGKAAERQLCYTDENGVVQRDCLEMIQRVLANDKIQFGDTKSTQRTKAKLQRDWDKKAKALLLPLGWVEVVAEQGGFLDDKVSGFDEATECIRYRYEKGDVVYQYYVTENGAPWTNATPKDDRILRKTIRDRSKVRTECGLLVPPVPGRRLDNQDLIDRFI